MEHFSGEQPYNFTPVETEAYYRLREIMDKYFVVENVALKGDAIKFSYSAMTGARRAAAYEFAALGFKLSIVMGKDGRGIGSLEVFKGPTAETRRKENIKAVLLFAATLVSTTFAGWVFSTSMYEAGHTRGIWVGAFSFSISLLLILGAHESGHYFASLRYGIDASPPYFIPFPSIIGTMGAVIRIRSPIPDKDAAVRLGISGPLAGFIVAVPVFVAGVLLSRPVPAPEAQGDMIMFGNSIFTSVVGGLLINVPEGQHLFFHPMAIAAWVGIFVTGLNLIPVGQFDGGHLARALLGDTRFRYLCWILIVGMAVMGRFWHGWYVWSLIGYLITIRGIPPTMNEGKPVSQASKIWAAVGLILFVLCFMPVPIKII